MPSEDDDRLERIVLLHLLEHRGQQIRFEASHWATEIGILRRFSAEDPIRVKAAIRALEMTRMIYRRIQYVVGFSEPKNVFSLTATGHRKAIEYAREGNGGAGNSSADDPPISVEESDETWSRRAPEPNA
jgi:hypothetical protein